MTRPGIRWTIGDVSDYGWDALRLSVWGAWRLFGGQADYAICVNTVPLTTARALAGALPRGIEWRDVTGDVPAVVGKHVDVGMAEGVCWKFAPIRLFPTQHELSLDNDCILWDMPDAIDRWLSMNAGGPCLLAEDVLPCYGQFAAVCDREPRNTGIRGLPPGFDLESRLRAVLDVHPVTLRSELDEQGLQLLALSDTAPLLVVDVSEVSICSPFHPHNPELGNCGAHFVGLNARHLPWNYFDRPATEVRRDHWRFRREAVAQKVGVCAWP